MTDKQLLSFDMEQVLAQYGGRTMFNAYYELLMRENETVNLVSRETTRNDFDRMVAESLLPLSLCDFPITRYLDVGSGGGLPSIPILLVTPSIHSATLCERTQKKAFALGRILKKLGLSAELVGQDFSELSSVKRCDLVTLRYVRLEPALLTGILKQINSPGLFIYYGRPEFDPKPAPQALVEFAATASDGSLVSKSLAVWRT